jgi:hypothetical protein
MNRCPDNSEWVLWAADEVEPELRRRLEAHRAVCGDCRRESAAVARGLGALGCLSAAEPRAEAMVALRRKLEAAAQKRAATPRVIRLFNRHRWAASAAAVFVLAIGVWSFIPRAEQQIIILPRSDVQVQDDLTRITADIMMLETADSVAIHELAPVRPTVDPATVPNPDVDEFDMLMDALQAEMDA